MRKKGEKGWGEGCPLSFPVQRKWKETHVCHRGFIWGEEIRNQLKQTLMWWKAMLVLTILVSCCISSSLWLQRGYCLKLLCVFVSHYKGGILPPLLLSYVRVWWCFRSPQKHKSKPLHQNWKTLSRAFAGNGRHSCKWVSIIQVWNTKGWEGFSHSWFELIWDMLMSPKQSDLWQSGFARFKTVDCLLSHFQTVTFRFLLFAKKCHYHQHWRVSSQ